MPSVDGHVAAHRALCASDPVPDRGAHGEWLIGLLGDARVGALVRAFCGATCVLACSQFFVKPAATASDDPAFPARELGWHQDGQDSVQAFHRHVTSHITYHHALHRTP